MKETTTTIVTTEVTRRAPRKKTIVGADHVVSDGRTYIVEHHASQWPGEGKGISRVSASKAKGKMQAGLSNSMGPKQTEGRMCLATSLLHLSAIRNGLCDIASHPNLSLLDKDDCERLQIIAVQLNEFIPILRDIMTKRVSLFANYQSPAF